MIWLVYTDLIKKEEKKVLGADSTHQLHGILGIFLYLCCTKKLTKIINCFLNKMSMLFVIDLGFQKNLFDQIPA